MKTASLFLCAALLCGCSSTPLFVQNAPAEKMYRDAQFQPPSEPINIDRIFFLDADMKQYLVDNILRNSGGKDPRRALFDALYRKDRLQLDYDSAITRNAQETFHARAGNCLSLAIMTAALTRELGISVQFQLIEVENSWSRSGSLYFSSNHVNLLLGNPKMDPHAGFNVGRPDTLTVDFIPISDKARQAAIALEERTIIAMYLNNRAAEMLARDKVDDAYWLARKAIDHDPRFLNAYNTLGVIYQHHNNLPEAEQVLRYALSQAPNNTIFLSNLAQNLEDSNKPAEAAVLRQRLAQLEPYPPFYYFKQGQEAMDKGNYVKARDLFRRELDRVPDYHEFHFWLAQAAYQLGDLREADEHMKLALANSLTRGEHDLYAAKLDRIKAYEARPARQ
jgi:Tfp pilus assembly protein PilF